MNRTSDQVQPDARPAQNSSGSTSQTGSRRPQSESALERIQKYLAPLQRLGNQRVAWLGSLLLLIGVFLPAKAASIPFANLTVSASIWDFAKFEGFLLIVLALASAGLAYLRDYKWLWGTATAATLFLVIEFFASLTETYIHPAWGWFILFSGLILLFAAAAQRRDPLETTGDAASVVKQMMQRVSSGR